MIKSKTDRLLTQIYMCELDGKDLRTIKQRAIVERLIHTGFNRTKTAESLDVGIRTVQRCVKTVLEQYKITEG